MYGGKFGGNFIPETLKKPIELNSFIGKLRYDKKFLKERDYYFKIMLVRPPLLSKLNNLTNKLGGAQIYAKVVQRLMGGAHKDLQCSSSRFICKRGW